MNWPSPGTDRSYNPDGDTRKTYYGVTGIPEHFVNGAKSNGNWSSPFTAANTTYYTAEADSSHGVTVAAFMDLTATYKIDTIAKKVSVVTKVTPHFTKSGAYTVYVALCDKHYQNTTNTTGQLDYYHVVRKMLPTASGHAVTSWTDGTAQTFIDNDVPYTADNWNLGSASYPNQGSLDFWSNPLLGSELVAFVEEDATKSVMQSFVALPLNKLSTSTMSKVTGINVYPNPAKDFANVSFTLGETGNVQVNVIEYSGRILSTVTNTTMTAGLQTIKVPTANLAAGNYVVLITTATGSNAERLTVEK